MEQRVKRFRRSAPSLAAVQVFLEGYASMVRLLRLSRDAWDRQASPGDNGAP